MCRQGCGRVVGDARDLQRRGDVGVRPGAQRGRAGDGRIAASLRLPANLTSRVESVSWLLLEVAAVGDRDGRRLQVAWHRSQDPASDGGPGRRAAAGVARGVFPLRSVPPAAGTVTDCRPARSGAGGMGDRPPARASSVDRLPGAAPQPAAARPGHLRRRPGSGPRAGRAAAATSALSSRQPELRRIVQGELEEEWSRAQIAAHLREAHPERPTGTCVTRPSVKRCTAGERATRAGH